MRERFRPEHRKKKARLDQEEKDLLMRKNQILIQGSSISGVGNINGAGNGTLQELKKFVSSWRMTKDADSFPEEAFTNFVEDCTVLSGKMITFQFRCGLKLTESLYKVELSDANHKYANNKEDH